MTEVQFPEGALRHRIQNGSGAHPPAWI